MNAKRTFMLRTRLTAAEHTKLMAAAKKRGFTMSQLVRDAFRQYVKKSA